MNMKKVLLVKPEQKPLVDDYFNTPFGIKVVQDGLGREIISVECKYVEEFSELWSIFNEMEEVDFVPVNND